MREQAEKDYIAGMKYKDIAEKYGVSINTVKSWKQRYNWNKNRVHTKPEKGAHKNEKVCTQNKRPRGAPKGNKNAAGNKGGKGGPVGNNHAVTHGFFRRIFPEDDETLALLKNIQEQSPLDMLWNSIQIQMLAIARAQQIMWVTDKEEMIKELKRSYEKNNNRSTEKTSSSSNECEYEYEFQFAWDRQATFLKSQSRAMGELRSLIKQYDELLKTELATEEQQLRIEKLRADIEKIKDPASDKPIEVIIKRKGDG